MLSIINNNIFVERRNREKKSFTDHECGMLSCSIMLAKRRRIFIHWTEKFSLMQLTHRTYLDSSDYHLFRSLHYITDTWKERFC